MAKFSERCRKLREKIGATQEEFAVMLGVKNRQGKITIARWETGAYKPSADYLMKFLKLEEERKKK